MRRTVPRSGARYGSALNARLITAARCAGSASASRGPARPGPGGPAAVQPPARSRAAASSPAARNPLRGQQPAQEHVPVGGQPRPERCRITGQATGIGQLIHPVTVTRRLGIWREPDGKPPGAASRHRRRGPQIRPDQPATCRASAPPWKTECITRRSARPRLLDNGSTARALPAPRHDPLSRDSVTMPGRSSVSRAREDRTHGVKGGRGNVPAQAPRPYCQCRMICPTCGHRTRIATASWMRCGFRR